jgi:hypothetical protein
MTKLSKKIFIIVSFLFILLSSGVFSQKYSIDNERNMKSRKVKKQKLSREERYVIKLQKKQNKQEVQKKKKNEKLYKNAVKKYNKNVGGSGREVVNQEKVYKRMKQNKKAARKNNRKRTGK